MLRRRSRGRGGQKRKMTWTWAGLYANQSNPITEDFIFATWARVPAGYVDNADTSGIPIKIEPDWTLVRSRCICAVFSNNQGAQVVYPWTFSFGLIAWDGISDDTDDLGFIPHPYYDQELDWIWRNDFAATSQNVFTTAVGGDKDSYESRAMRKLSNGTGLLFVSAIADPVGALPLDMVMTVNMNFRGLYKLP